MYIHIGRGCESKLLSLLCGCSIVYKVQIVSIDNHCSGYLGMAVQVYV